MLQSASRGDSQLAYEMQVTPQASELAWSSGRVASAAQHLVVPTVLDSGVTHSFRVRAWLSSQPDHPSDWGCSDSSFDTAPATSVFPGSAAWIGGGGKLRTSPEGGLHLPNGTVSRARAFVSGVGAFDLFVNGVRVGENVMDPPQSVYSKSVLYSSFDIAPSLEPGTINSFGALLGTYKWSYTDLWCNMSTSGPDCYRALILKVVVTMADGSNHSLETAAAGWQARIGHITWDHFFHGEDYDGRIEFDWRAVCEAGAAGTAGWRPAHVVTPAATSPVGMQVTAADGSAIALGLLRPSLAPPLRVMERLPAMTVRATEANDTASRVYVFNFGRNMAGMVKGWCS
jgi:alpha-L-rhamnosidase